MPPTTRAQSRSEVLAGRLLIRWLHNLPRLHNKTDPITLEPVGSPPTFLLVAKTGAWAFNADELVKFFHHTKLLENPYTRQCLVAPEIARLNRISNETDVPIGGFPADDESPPAAATDQGQPDGNAGTADPSVVQLLENEVGEAFHPMLESLHSLEEIHSQLSRNASLFAHALALLHQADPARAHSTFDHIVRQVEILRDRSQVNTWVSSDACTRLLGEIMILASPILAGLPIASPRFGLVRLRRRAINATTSPTRNPAPVGEPNTRSPLHMTPSDTALLMRALTRIRSEASSTDELSINAQADAQGEANSANLSEQDSSERVLIAASTGTPIQMSIFAALVAPEMIADANAAERNMWRNETPPPDAPWSNMSFSAAQAVDNIPTPNEPFAPPSVAWQPHTPPWQPPHDSMINNAFMPDIAARRGSAAPLMPRTTPRFPTLLSASAEAMLEPEHPSP